jgi:hypothetical protein
LSAWTRRGLTALTAPVGAMLLFFVSVPGPCTTFNDLDAGAVDAGCDAGFAFNFMNPEDGACQSLANTLCCTQILGCTSDAACNAALECLNDCGLPLTHELQCIGSCRSMHPATTAVEIGFGQCFYPDGGDASLATSCVGRP